MDWWRKSCSGQSSQAGASPAPSFPYIHLRCTDTLEVATMKRERRKQRPMTAVFKLRARRMVPTEEALVAEKVAILEGTPAGEQSGDVI